MPTPDDEVLLEVSEGVAVVTFNRPDRLNAISRPMAGRVCAILGDLRARDDVRAVILTGSGRAFCAGADLSRRGERGHLGERIAKKDTFGTFGDLTRAI